MRIAVPTRDGAFSEHFGRSTGFLLCDVQEPDRGPGQVRQIVRKHGTGKCESLPEWLAEMGITHLLVGGIGEVGRRHFEQLGIVVSVGYSGRDPQAMLRQFLDQPPSPAKNPCAEFEHRHRHCHGGGKRKPST